MAENGDGAERLEVLGAGPVAEDEVDRPVRRPGQPARDSRGVCVAVLRQEHVQQVVPLQLVELVDEQRHVAGRRPTPLGAVLRHPRPDLGERRLAVEGPGGVVVFDVALEGVHLAEDRVGNPPGLAPGPQDADRHDGLAAGGMDHREPHRLNVRQDPVGDDFLLERRGIVRLGPDPRPARQEVQQAFVELLVEAGVWVVALLPVEAERLAEGPAGPAAEGHHQVVLRVLLVLEDEDVGAPLVLDRLGGPRREGLVNALDPLRGAGGGLGLGDGLDVARGVAALAGEPVRLEVRPERQRLPRRLQVAARRQRAAKGPRVRLDHRGVGVGSGEVAAAVGHHEIVVLPFGDAVEDERAEVHVVDGVARPEVGLPLPADLREGRAVVGPEVVAAGEDTEGKPLKLVGGRAGGLLFGALEVRLDGGQPRDGRLDARLAEVLKEEHAEGQALDLGRVVQVHHQVDDGVHARLEREHGAELALLERVLPCIPDPPAVGADVAGVIIVQQDVGADGQQEAAHRRGRGVLLVAANPRADAEPPAASLHHVVQHVGPVLEGLLVEELQVLGPVAHGHAADEGHVWPSAGEPVHIARRGETVALEEVSERLLRPHACRVDLDAPGRADELPQAGSLLAGCPLRCSQTEEHRQGPHRVDRPRPPVSPPFHRGAPLSFFRAHPHDTRELIQLEVPPRVEDDSPSASPARAETRAGRRTFDASGPRSIFRERKRA